MIYNSHTLSNGFRLIHVPDGKAVTYCGVIINAGSRDENENEQGMAHFVEHILFKGTGKRRAGHIINRLENVGGELNAFTSKEETVVYATILNEHTERAIELIADILFNSTFPQKEINKEIEIIIDEIQSYNDSPSELIYDDFEEIIFSHHPIGRNILGKAEELTHFTTAHALNFTKKNYFTEEMVLFVLGNIETKKIVRWAEKYFNIEKQKSQKPVRIAPSTTKPQKIQITKNTHQVHYILGNRAYNLYHPNRMGLYLLNNILGGPGMNSLLNLSLREKHGLVYSVESTYQAMTDTGMWTIYFGTDSETVNRCEQLVLNVLQKLRNQPLTTSELNKYKLQLIGQLAISNEQKENLALNIGKSFLRYGKIDSMENIIEKINKITAIELQQIACEIFNPKEFTILKYV